MCLIRKALEYSVLIAFVSSCMLCLNKHIQFLSFLVLPLVCFKLEKPCFLLRRCKSEKCCW